MLSADENQPGGKSGQRNRNTERQRGKAEQRRRKSSQQKTSEREQLQSAEEQVAAVIAPAIDRADTVQMQTADVEAAHFETATMETANSETATSAPASPETGLTSIQAIANAYGDYTKRSLEETGLFFEKLGRARSLDTVFELHAEFVKQAWDRFIADSQKIRELHRNLGRQTWAGVETFAAGMSRTVLPPRAARS